MDIVQFLSILHRYPCIPVLKLLLVFFINCSCVDLPEKEATLGTVYKSKIVNISSKKKNNNFGNLNNPIFS